MKKTVRLSTEKQVSELTGMLRIGIKAHGVIYVTYTSDKPRSLNQNALSHEWYEQISLELREGSTLDVKCECKLNYGVPILRADDTSFREQYDSLIKGRFTYEEKLELMKWFPVTSLMNTDQLSRYLDAMQTAFSKRGVALEFPNE